MTTILSPNHSIISPANSVSSTSSSRTNDSGISITNGKLTASQKQYAETCSFPFCDDVKKYRKIAKIGHGTYGEVFKACNPSNNQFVALKSINNNNNKAIGFPMLSIREISILKRIKHENVVNLIEVCRSTRTGSGRDHTNFYLVLEFCEHDLAGILANTNVQLNSGEIKNLLKQLFNGIEFIHSHRIFHRDLKPSNILVTKNGVIKLTDFGLARQFNLSYDQYRPVTPSNSLVTLWYRPPELLLGDQNYGPSIDMWSLGLIMAEMWFRAPIIQGKSEQEQIYLIIQLCGSIKPTVWPNVTRLPLYQNIIHMKKNNIPRNVKERLRSHIRDSKACDLIDKLLILDPTVRFDANAAVNHTFFSSNPLPSDLTMVFARLTQSMFQFHTRKRRSYDTGYVDHIY